MSTVVGISYRTDYLDNRCPLALNNPVIKFSDCFRTLERDICVSVSTFPAKIFSRSSASLTKQINGVSYNLTKFYALVNFGKAVMHFSKKLGGLSSAGSEILILAAIAQ